jgi:hypothetical protein
MASTYSPLTILTDPQLLAICDAFETASMETGVGEEGLLFWYAVLEEIARRDLINAEARADEADWIISLLFPAPVKRIVIDRPPLPPGLPGVSVKFAEPQ